jgi:hypothetical protein
MKSVPLENFLPDTLSNFQRQNIQYSVWCILANFITIWRWRSSQGCPPCEVYTRIRGREAGQVMRRNPTAANAATWDSKDP